MCRCYDNYNGSKEDRLQRAQEGLESRISKGAAHNSAERSQWYTPKCHEGTRKAVQDDMLSWIAHGKEKVLWLTGPAGTGKSAIAGSIADSCHHQSRKLREEILRAIDACPSVFDKTLDEQLDTLILEPLRKVGQDAIRSSTFKTIIIDGVDECKADPGIEDDVEVYRRRSTESNHREIISSLVRASNDPSFPFRIIIANPPERAIQQFFSSLSSSAFKHIFLNDTLTQRPTLNFPARKARYNRQDAPRYLAQEASGQFIYAEVAIRYIEGGPGTPHEQLKRVLNWQGVKSSRPFAVLDALYSGILKSSPDPPLSIKWLRVIKYLQDVPLIAILESSPGQTEVVLGRLTALVGLSNNNGQPAFTFYHKSLADFLIDKVRCGKLHLEAGAAGDFLRERYYQVLKNRGPQGFLPPDLQEFDRSFCFDSWRWIDRNRQYDPRDVDWWFELIRDPVNPLGHGLIRNASDMFSVVHRKCHWYHCLPACRVWRKGILKYLKGIRYPVPTPLHLFIAKGRRWRQLGEVRRDDETLESWKVTYGIYEPSIEEGPSDSTSS
ncbi:hypothetical protein NMY22_g1728 [Coprinellus aureogranulatus]|nr:hypothetical protein NMY22_g1728 [Coprinellus aureogranulatus]